MGLGTEPSTAQHQDSTGIDPSHGLGARPAPWGPGGPWGPAVGVCAPFLSGCTLPHVPQHFCHPLPGTVFAIWSSGVPRSGLGGGTGLCGDTAPQCLGMWGGNGIAWSPRSDPSSEVFGPGTHGAGTLAAGVTTRGSQNQGAGGRGRLKLGPRSAGGTWAPRPPPLPGSGQPHSRGLVWGAEPRNRPGPGWAHGEPQGRGSAVRGRGPPGRGLLRQRVS